MRKHSQNTKYNDMRPESVFILDGEQRSALAATRSLGAKGFRVIVGSELSSSLSGASKYCSAHFQYSSPYYTREKFISELKNVINREKIDLLLPMTDISLFNVLSYENEIRTMVNLPFVTLDKYSLASNKLKLMKTAAQLDIPIPATVFVEDPDFQTSPYEGKYPVVLKPMASLIESGDTILRCGVKFADSHSQFMSIIKNNEAFKYPFMIQERLKGEGVGVFCLFDNGKPMVVFSHKRIREKPPWGGVSVVSESTSPDPQAKEYALRLLEALQWDGVAMVEFKRDVETGLPKLMEINARFWGSLQLAIDSGVDFPYLLYLKSKNALPLSIDYKEGQRLRWFLGDLDSLYLLFKFGNRDSRSTTRTRDTFLALYDFIREFMKNSRSEIFRRHDVWPCFWEIKDYVHNVLRRRNCT